MRRATSPKRLSFTVFRSASEEADMKAEQENWDNEGGHMTSTAGHVVRTPRCVMPYKVALTHDVGAPTEYAFATMQEAEAFIRRNTPRPAARCTLFDRAANEGLGWKPLREVVT